MNPTTLRFTPAAALAAIVTTLTLLGPSQAAIIVDDSWTDGGRDNGANPRDSNWWTSASSQGIEVAVGSLGMVTGTSGRGIHTIFPTQTLAIGDNLKATYTFRTPATVAGGVGSGVFRVGFFDTLGRADLDADVSASSGTPNAVYGWGTGAGGPGTAGLPGYMMDMDTGANADLNFRQHDAGTVNPTGRLMGTTAGFTSITPSGPDGAYLLQPNTTYTGSLMLTRTSATDMQITGTLTTPSGTATHSVTDAFDSTSYGMLAFWANSNIFGSSSTPNTPDNGIDFSNVLIQFNVPEPATISLLGVGIIGLLANRRGRRCAA